MTPIEAGARALAKQRSGVDLYDGLGKERQLALQNDVRAVLKAYIASGEIAHGDPFGLPRRLGLGW